MAMDSDDLENLQPGDTVEHISTEQIYIVTANYWNRATAVQTVDITNPVEWKIVSKVETRSFPQEYGQG